MLRIIERQPFGAMQWDIRGSIRLTPKLLALHVRGTILEHYISTYLKATPQWTILTIPLAQHSILNTIASALIVFYGRDRRPKHALDEGVLVRGWAPSASGIKASNGPTHIFNGRGRYRRNLSRTYTYTHTRWIHNYYVLALGMACGQKRKYVFIVHLPRPCPFDDEHVSRGA